MIPANSVFPHAHLSNEVHGYKEILFPIDSGLKMDGLHIWPRNSHMLMALANLDGSMTGTLYMNTTAGDLSFEAIKDKDSAQKFFETYYADVSNCMMCFCI